MQAALLRREVGNRLVLDHLLNKGTEHSWVKLERKPYMCISPCDQFTNYSPTDSNGNTGLSWLFEAGSCYAARASFSLEVLPLMPPECWDPSWMPPFLATLKLRTLCCWSTLLPTVLIILFPSLCTEERKKKTRHWDRWGSFKWRQHCRFKTLGLLASMETILKVRSHPLPFWESGAHQKGISSPSGFLYYYASKFKNY